MQSQYEDASSLSRPVAAIVERVFSRYKDLSESRRGLERAFWSIAEVLADDGVLYLCGNGGSFADAVHIKGELAKSFVRNRPITDATLRARLPKFERGERLLAELEMGFPVVVLGESHALRSAYENDRDPLLHYAQELNSFAAHLRPGVLMGISTSGNAENVCSAMTLARAYDIRTVSFTGPGGGKLAELAEIDWQVRGDSTSEIQEHQVVLYHGLCMMIEAHFFAG